MNSLVLGGSGYLGKELIDQLSKSGDVVYSVDKVMPKNRLNGIDYMVCDITNYSQVEELFKEQAIDRVFHFAGISDIRKASESFTKTIETNALSTIYLLEAMKSFDIQQLIFASTMYVFSDKGGVYRLSKQIAEQIIADYCEINKLNFAILRFGSIYGPGSDETNGLHQLVKTALTTKKLKYEGNPESIREYIHIKDAIKACLDIAKFKLEGGTYHLISGDIQFKIADVLLMIKEMLDIDVEIEYGGSKEDGHYISTPYSFRPKRADKYRSLSSIDFSHGLWELISYIDDTNISIDGEKN